MGLTSPVVWLVVSVVVNAVLAGVVVGGAIAHSRSIASVWPEHRRGHFVENRSVGGDRVVSRTKRRWLRRDLARAWRRSGAERAALEDARERFVQAVRSDVVDQTELRAALGDLRTARAALAARTEDVVVAHIVDLPSEERDGLLRVIEELPAGPRSRGGGDHHD